MASFIRLVSACVLSSFFFSASATRIDGRDFGTITTSTNGSVVRATINNPPVNLYDEKVITDLYDFLKSLDTEQYPKVVIFESANDQFFIDHLDLRLLSANSPPPGNVNSTDLLGKYEETVHLLKDLPTIFIAEINGIATGAGNELSVQMDMRFAGPAARLGSLEVGIGLTHGNGGIQYVTKLIGLGRAAEYLLSSGDVDAATAAEIGWVNKAYLTKAELQYEVNKLAHRIATFPAGALKATKEGISENRPNQTTLDNDLARFQALVGTEAAQTAIDRFLVLSKNQTLSTFELGLNGDLVKLYN